MSPPRKVREWNVTVKERDVMATPATFKQSRRVLDFFDEVGVTSEMLQNWLGAGDLQKLMLTADLSKVDRDAFRALLAPEPASIDWMPVDQYGDKLRDWNQRFELGLTELQITDLVAKLPDHDGPHLPTAIRLLLGKGLQDDWKVVMRVLKYELEKLGVPFTEYFDASRLSYFTGSELFKVTEPTLDVAPLDIGTFWDPQNGVVPREVRTQRGCWPGLEVGWLLALNPQVFLAMDGETVPFMWAPGLVVDSDSLPYFCRDSGEAFVYDYWGDGQWHGSSVVAFREC